MLAVIGNMVLTLEAMGRHSEARSLKTRILGLGPDQIAEQLQRQGYGEYENDYEETEWDEGDISQEWDDWGRNGVNAFNRFDKEQWGGRDDRVQWRGDEAHGGWRVESSSWGESSWADTGVPHSSPNGAATQRERWPSLDRTPGNAQGRGGRGGQSRAVDPRWTDVGGGRGKGGSSGRSQATKQTLSSGRGGGAYEAGYGMGNVRNDGKKHSAVLGGSNGSWSSYEEVDTPSSARSNGNYAGTSSSGRTRKDWHQDWP